MTDSTQINTPDGPGIRLSWPAGISKHFVETSGTGFEQTTNNYVAVTPVLLGSGEVRFYAEHALS